MVTTSPVMAQQIAQAESAFEQPTPSIDSRAAAARLVDRLPGGSPMSTVRWQSLGQLWNEFERAHNDMNRVLQHLDTRGPAGLFGVPAAYPPVNVWDDDENIYLEAELPGITRENLEIT